MVQEVVHPSTWKPGGVFGLGRGARLRGADGAQGGDRGGRPRESCGRRPFRVSRQGTALVSEWVSRVRDILLVDSLLSVVLVRWGSLLSFVLGGGALWSFLFCFG